MYRNIIKSVMENCIDIVKKDSTFLELCSIILKSSNKILAVIDNDKIVGVIDYNDLLINILKDINNKNFIDILNKEVSNFMNKNFLIAYTKNNITNVFDTMIKNKIDYMVIINADNYPIGIVNIYDLFDYTMKLKIRNMNFNINEIEKKSSIEKDKIIKELMEKVDTLYEQSIVDPLTGLFNVRYLNKIIKKEVDRSRRYKYSISIIFIDLDYFKDINDTYGHDCGNMVLYEIGKLLNNDYNYFNILRNSDIAIRYGGEEFVIICPNTKKEQAFILAERIRKNVEKKKFEYKSSTINVTVSIGIAEHKGLSKKPISDAIKNADSAMYKSKNLGRNRVTLY